MFFSLQIFKNTMMSFINNEKFDSFFSIFAHYFIFFLKCIGSLLWDFWVAVPYLEFLNFLLFLTYTGLPLLLLCHKEYCWLWGFCIYYVTLKSYLFLFSFTKIFKLGKDFEFCYMSSKYYLISFDQWIGHSILNIKLLFHCDESKHVVVYYFLNGLLVSICEFPYKCKYAIIK